MFTDISRLTHVVSTRLCGALLSTLLIVSSAGAQPIEVAGVIDATRGASVTSVLVGARGFSLAYNMSILDNFIDLERCGLPECRAGDSLSLQVSSGESCHPFIATVDAATYHGGCDNAASALVFQISGTVVLPPLSQTGTASARFTFSGWLGAQAQPRVDFFGAGTATVYLHALNAPGFPTTWNVDRVVFRFDGPLPTPFTSVDVGAVGIAGRASAVDADADAFAVSGSGGDIWGVADAFHFAIAHPSGREVVARVDQMQPTHPDAKAGIMIRRSLDPSSPHAVLDVKPDGGIEFMTRSAAGGVTTFIAGAQVQFPVWLKLTESPQITASISSDGQIWQTLGTAVPFVGPTVMIGTLKGLVVTSHDSAMLNEATFSRVSVRDDREPLESGWQQSDIGIVQFPGSATTLGTTLTMAGAGTDIWGTSDSFHYAYTRVNTDSEIVAQVTSLQNTSPWAKAGVMIRGSLLPDAPHVLLAVKPDGGIEFLERRAAGAASALVAEDVQPFPAWLKLGRIGSIFTASISSDGVTWRPIGQTTVADLRFATVIGLAVTSQNPDSLNAAVFDSIAVNSAQGPPAPWIGIDVGSIGLPGGTTFAGGTYTVRGAGADVWGTSDGFHYMLQGIGAKLSTLSARLVSESSTHPYAKAGVMIRSGVAASAAFALISMKPDGEIEVLQRDVNGGSVAYVTGASPGFGSHLRLQRANATSVVASYSSDGSTWNELATIPVQLGSSPVIGLIATSHDVAQINAAVFDSVVGP